MLITVGHIKRIIKEALERLLIEDYRLAYNDEIMDYLWLKPQRTGLNVDVFVDDGFSYKRNSHPLLLFVRNGYDRTANDFIPITISQTPKIIDNNIELNISYNEISEVIEFIQHNLKIIYSLANDKISIADFWKRLKPYKGRILESQDIIEEMSRLRAQDSNLPMDIWVDEGVGYRGHAPRIKFKASNEQRTTNEYSTMILSNPPQIENMPKDSFLRKRDIDILKNFVVSNLELLLQLYKGEIDYEKQFFPNFIRASRRKGK